MTIELDTFHRATTEETVAAGFARSFGPKLARASRTPMERRLIFVDRKSFDKATTHDGLFINSGYMFSGLTDDCIKRMRKIWIKQSSIQSGRRSFV
jgi:hypothetical protein